MLSRSVPLRNDRGLFSYNYQNNSISESIRLDLASRSGDMVFSGGPSHGSKPHNLNARSVLESGDRCRRKPFRCFRI